MGNTPHKSRITVNFTEFQHRNGVMTSDILREIQEGLKDEFTAEVEITVDKEANGPPQGPPVNIEVTGKVDYGLLNAEAEKIKDFLNKKNVKGVETLKLNVQANRPEIPIVVDRDQVRKLNASTMQVAMAIRKALLGEDVTTYTKGEDSYDLMLRFNKSNRESFDALLDQRLIFRNNKGKLLNIPIRSVVEDTKEVTSYTGVVRKDQVPLVTVSSNVTEGANPNEVVAELKKHMEEYEKKGAMADGISYKFTGQQEEQAKIAQAQEIETLKAAQEAEIAARREDSMRETERARIAREESIRAAEIARERKIRDAEIAKERELEVAEQERQVVIAQKSEEESRARASADLARAEATKATEAVATARQVAEAERLKQIALIEAAREAEREATAIRLSAQAEKEAAADRAEARREEAQAEADALNIRAEAKKNDMLAEAEGKRAIVEADNVLSAAQIRMKVDLARIEAMPSIISEMVKPAEKIDSIKIHQVSGIGAGAPYSAAGAGNGAEKPVVNQALDSIMGMAVQMPALKKLGEELGLSMENGVSGVASQALGLEPEEAEAADVPLLNGSASDPAAEAEETAAPQS